LVEFTLPRETGGDARAKFVVGGTLLMYGPLIPRMTRGTSEFGGIEDHIAICGDDRGERDSYRSWPSSASSRRLAGMGAIWMNLQKMIA